MLSVSAKFFDFPSLSFFFPFLTTFYTEIMQENGMACKKYIFHPLLCSMDAQDLDNYEKKRKHLKYFNVF